MGEGLARGDSIMHTFETESKALSTLTWMLSARIAQEQHNSYEAYVRRASAHHTKERAENVPTESIA